MARRNQTTDLGCIACDELGDVGAGKEGWLVDNSDVLCALETHLLALANRSLALVVGWATGNSQADPPIRIRPTLSPIEAETITAIEWIAYDDLRVLLVGTSCGNLMFYSVGGDMIHKQMIHPGRILKLRVCGMKKDLTQEMFSDEVSVIMSGVIARFDGSYIQSMLQRWSQESHSQFWDENLKKKDPKTVGNSYDRLPYQIWNVSKNGPCADAAITGIMPPPLLELELSLLLGSQVNVTIVRSLLEMML